MDPFSMVAVIVVVSCLTAVVNNYLKLRRHESASGSARQRIDEELTDLRRRVEVLEKIVVDERYELRRELNQLERQA